MKTFLRTDMMDEITDDFLIETGRKVFRIESDALTQFSQDLDESFANAVRLLLKTRGRVVVVGMGKSGHVARKIAATLASTGTPAQFVHPGEASHGDMGMMTPEDVVLILSNSGETPELANVIAHTRRFSIPMIGVASKPDSTLLKQADIALVLPNAKEACRVGVAPTTSTTMTLALGDALAVALMECRMFGHEEYKVFHPGGILGARLNKVSQLMHDGAEVPIVTPDNPMSDTLLEITQKGFGVAAVCNEDQLVGVITDGDLRRHMVGLLDLSASDVMTANPQTIEETALAEEALARMNERKITTLFVTPEGEPRRLVGIIHLHDCLRSGLG